MTGNIGEVTRASNETGSAAVDVNEAARELSTQSETLRSVVDSFLGNVREVV